MTEFGPGLPTSKRARCRFRSRVCGGQWQVISALSPQVVPWAASFSQSLRLASKMEPLQEEVISLRGLALQIQASKVGAGHALQNVMNLNLFLPQPCFFEPSAPVWFFLRAGQQ